MAFEAEALSPLQARANALNARPARRSSERDPARGRRGIPPGRQAGARLVVRRGVRGAVAPGRPDRSVDPGAVPGYRAAFRQTLDYRKQTGRQARPDRRARPAPGLRRPGHPGPVRRPLQDLDRRLLQHPQGAAAGPRPGRVRRLDHGPQAVPEQYPAEPAGGRGRRGQDQVQPPGNWSKTEIDAYAKQHDLPAHPLVQFGYPSIGCWPCTNPVEEGQDARSGRLAGPGQGRVRHPRHPRGGAVERTASAATSRRGHAPARVRGGCAPVRDTHPSEHVPSIRRPSRGR
ncbi:MAG: phosphoadenosine phosphosulfate reductase family protein [Caulobacteraceae bacterium]